jgi:signal transduction histidine kinase
VREFDALVEAFNRMAERLEASRQELLATNQDLERRVRERTRQLEAEHEKLLRAERLSTLGLFSSAIAHDLRNPLSTVNLGIYWLKSRLADTPDERVHSRLTTIERELRRAEQIIKTLLAFARTGEPNREPADLNQLVREVVGVIDLLPNIALDLRLDPGLPPLAVDRAQLFQVLENLIRNAIQAMPGGGRVTVSSESTGNGCRLSVSDTGPGIPPDLHATIFEPLVTTKSSGTGLGLALCKRVVEAHGGRISIESAPGQGATFRIDLPAPEAADLPGSGSPSVPQSPPREPVAR